MTAPSSDLRRMTWRLTKALALDVQQVDMDALDDVYRDGGDEALVKAASTVMDLWKRNHGWID